MAYYVLAWCGLVPVMILNGLARQALYGPALSELRAHQLSTATGIALVFAYAWLVVPRLHLERAPQAWTVGLVWLVLTVAFEFGFGHFVAGHSFERLLQDYDLSSGRLWPLLLLAVLVAPRLVHAPTH